MTDFFTRDFPTASVRLNLITQPRAAPLLTLPDAFTEDFRLCSSKNLETGELQTEVRQVARVSIPKVKMDLRSTTVLSTANAVTQQFTLYNPLIAGLKVDALAGLGPSGAAPRLGLEFVQPTLHASLYGSATAVNADISTRVKDVQLGGEASFSPYDSSLQSYSFGIMLDRPRERIGVRFLNGLETLQTSYHQKLSEQLELAYRATWTGSKSPLLNMEMGAKWLLAAGGFLKVICLVFRPRLITREGLGWRWAVT